MLIDVYIWKGLRYEDVLRLMCFCFRVFRADYYITPHTTDY